jgi:hypothetical protein
MRLWLLLVVILLFAGNASAQEDWIPIELVISSGTDSYYLDRNFDVLPSGNLKYRLKRVSKYLSMGSVKTLVNIDVFEADCKNLRWRLISSPLEADSGLGHLMGLLKDWSSMSDGTHGVHAAAACRMAEERNAPKVVRNDKKVMKKRVAKRISKKKL